MDVFVSTSKIDPHPLVVSEAMSANSAVILSDRCGNWGYTDTVQHRYNGIVYPFGDINALTKAILTLTDDNLRRTYSLNGREIFLNQELDCEVKAFMKVIRKIQINTGKNNLISN